jgi:hypothetical protein
MGFAAVVNVVISVPHLQADMAEINVRPSLHRAVSLGLYFGTFAMFGLALVVLVAAVQASRGAATARPLLAIIATVYVTFGVGAFFAWSGSAHALGYTLVGSTDWFRGDAPRVIRSSEQECRSIVGRLTSPCSGLAHRLRLFTRR